MLYSIYSSTLILFGIQHIRYRSPGFFDNHPVASGTSFWERYAVVPWEPVVPDSTRAYRFATRFLHDDRPCDALHTTTAPWKDLNNLHDVARHSVPDTPHRVTSAAFLDESGHWSLCKAPKSSKFFCPVFGPHLMSSQCRWIWTKHR